MANNAQKAVKAQEPLLKKKNKVFTRTNMLLYAMFLPACICFILFCYLPMAGMSIAFADYRVVGGIKEWVGLKNFQYIWSLPTFWSAFGNTWIYVLLNYVFAFPAPILLAILLNELGGKKFKKSVQTLTILPHFLSWIVVGGIFQMVLSPNNGYLNELIKLFGGDPVYFLGREDFVYAIVTISRIWKGAGYSMIIYLAAISGIDQELYEAAKIDGANKLQQVLRITIPCILPTVLVVFVLSFTGVLNLYEPIVAFKNPYNAMKAHVLDTYIAEVGIKNSRYAIGMAASLFKSTIGLLFVLLSNRLSKIVSEDKKGIF